MKQIEFHDYLRVLRRGRLTIILTILVVVGASLVASLLQRPVYRATAELLLQARSTESLFDPTGGLRSDPARAIQNELRVLRSQPVLKVVRAKLGSDRAVVTVKSVDETDAIDIVATSTEPRVAAATANAYALAYIDFRRKQAVDDLFSAGKELQAKVTELQAQIDALPASVPKSGGNPGTDPRLDALLQQQALFKQKLDQLQVDAALKTGGAQLVAEAAVPTAPFKPTPERTGLVALAVGLLLGIGVTFVFEYLDDSIKTKEDVDRIAVGLPSLGVVPLVAGWKERGEPIVVSFDSPKSPAAEAYRSLRTSIQFMGLDRPLRTIQVTSASAAEGKSTTIANLGVALAQAGQRVVIVCCDLRRPRIHEFFGLENTVGFTSVLLGVVPLSAALQRVPGVNHLALLASGPVPPNPSELLSGSRARDVLTLLQAEADVVLIDCPPVLPVTDAAVLSSQVDATLLVASAGKTTRKQFQRAWELLAQVQAPIIGTVLNGVKEENSYGYTYGYSYESENIKKGRRQPAASV